MGKAISILDWPENTDIRLSEMDCEFSDIVERYKTLKKERAGKILFYRIGDFFEAFFDDAITASNILTLPVASGDMPMCGFPVYRLQEYQQKTMEAGYRVITCKEIQRPSKNKSTKTDF